ncbi:MAG: acyltransferase [Colwellia sp.]|nr:acyltransferase [Colwellia sp.]
MKINKENNLNWVTNLFIPNLMDMPSRRYDLDWLRIIVFVLLILYHTGMFYVENWGWHVKSTYQSQFLENIMLSTGPWRMAVLWLISGIAIKFLMAKVSVWRFISMRSIRLLLPLLFGILIVVPPQLYIEMTFNGDLKLSYWQFMGEFFSSNSDIFTKYQAGIWPHIDVNHLWFIRSLWQFSLALICLLPILNSKYLTNMTNRLLNKNVLLILLLLVLPIFIIELNWDEDNVRYPLGFTFMLYGYLIGWNKTFWEKLSTNFKPLCIISVLSYFTTVFFYNHLWLDLIKGAEVENELLLLLAMFNYSLLRIVGLLTVLAFAVKYLNLKTKKLAYFNEAVYPFYILHQTIIVVVGYNLSMLSLGPVIEPILLIIITITCCFIGFEIIRRIEILRPCFGLKMNNNYSVAAKRLAYLLTTILIVPIGWRVLI